jgi:N6-L-threonylcarbamoyladenine synthase
MSDFILAIESSCDDTSAAVISEGQVLSNLTHTQIDHAKYGGVVPEVASRIHQEMIVPVVDAALEKAGIGVKDLKAIALTSGPGLVGSLLVGISFAKGMSLALDIPLIEVNHMRAHILAHFAEPPYPEFPFLCLTVSGGHTQIVRVNSHYDMQVLGSTIDDAAGEAFDKSGKLLGLPYPAGPHIDRLAQQGNPKFQFPEPQIPNLDFSFSGLKTSILYFLKKEIKNDPDFIEKNLADICASIQERIITILINKISKAAQQEQINQIALAGGVSANSGLRNALEEWGKEHNAQIFIPAFEYCTDNAGMVGIAGYYKYLRKEFASDELVPQPRMKIN